MCLVCVKRLPASLLWLDSLHIRRSQSKTLFSLSYTTHRERERNIPGAFRRHPHTYIRGAWRRLYWSVCLCLTTHTFSSSSSSLFRRLCSSSQKKRAGIAEGPYLTSDPSSSHLSALLPNQPPKKNAGEEYCRWHSGVRVMDGSQFWPNLFETSSWEKKKRTIQ